jgi:Xaa-Pro dipeptidase
MAGLASVVQPTTPRIQADEIRGRQERLRAHARELGLDGVLVWAHGATTQDHYADVLYLSGFYSHYPTISDSPGRWRAKGYVGLIVPVDGPITLVTDLATYREDLTVVDRVDTNQDVIAAAIKALRETVGPGKIGVLGSRALSWVWMRALEEEVGARFVNVHDLGWKLRMIQSPAEQELMRAAGRIGVLGVEAVMDAAVPGATEADVAAAGFEAVVSAGGMIYGISLSTGPYAHMYAQSQPAPFDSRRVLEVGDMARVDFYGSVDGYLFDFGRTRVVGRAPDAEQRVLMDAARDTVSAGLAVCRPGGTFGEVARACETALNESAFMRDRAGLAPEFFAFGHCLGLNWDEPWVEVDSDVVMVPGLCMAVEKRTALPGVGGATFEDNILITDDGYELLSDARYTYGDD